MHPDGLWDQEVGFEPQSAFCQGQSTSLVGCVGTPFMDREDLVQGQRLPATNKCSPPLPQLSALADSHFITLRKNLVELG